MNVLRIRSWAPCVLSPVGQPHGCNMSECTASGRDVSVRSKASPPGKGRIKKSTGKQSASSKPSKADSGEEELLELHAELMAQLNDRKTAQKKLLQELEEPISGSRAGKTTSRVKAAPVPQSLQTPRLVPENQPLVKQPKDISHRKKQPELVAEKKQPGKNIGFDENTGESAPPPREKNPNAMNIVLVGAECAPWSKTGGLGDVMGALPKALASRGHRVMTVAPRYREYDDAWETGVRHRMRVFNQEQEVGFFHAYKDGVDHVFVDHPAFLSLGNDIYSGSRQEIQFRYALLCKAALEIPWVVPCGGAPYGDESLVFIANDWHTSLLPVYLQAHYRDHGKYTYARSILVIHNIAHQGRGPMDDLQNLEIPPEYTETFRLYDPIGGEHMNIMKAGMYTAHRMIAVSHGYAWECQTQEGGWGLDGVVKENAWKLRGVVNGIDINDWNPKVDSYLTSDGYQQYDSTSLDIGKAACKAALQRELGLPEDPNIPLLGFIGRLDYQKGVDLIRDNYDWIMGQGAQLVLLGSGREDLEGDLRSMESRNHNQCRGWVGFSVQMAHRITAGADILLMPSRFEPCGLNQLYAMMYGTVPVVHAVGGLRDTVKPFNPFEEAGTGWTFEWADPGAFQSAMGNAIYTYREHKDSFRALQLRGMNQDLSWEHAAELYEDVLIQAKYQW